MKSAVMALLGISLLSAGTSFAASSAPAAATASAGPTSASHLKAVEDLLGAMQIQYLLRSVASRSRYVSLDHRQAVMAKLDKVPPAEIYRRMAPALAAVISSGTATEMTRFYTTPYGKGLIHSKYNNRGGIIFPGASKATTAPLAPEEKKERMRPAYVQASRDLAAAESVIDHEAFVLLQAINKENR